MPPTQKAMVSSSSAEQRHHSNAHTTSSSKKTNSTSARSQRTTASQSNSKDGRRSNSKQPSGASGIAIHYYDAHSESEDSYTVGGGFISEMDEHDSAFDGAMEYEEEDGRSLLGEDFDASSDVVVEVQENAKERRKREFQERLLKLELEFEENKQIIFAYQMARYKEEMDAILNGIHPDFHDQLEDLAQARDTAIANARLYRDYQFGCAQHAYELETELAEEEYMAEREGLREKMLAAIDNKRRALRDDKENLDITNDYALEPTSRAHHKRNLRKRGPEAEVGAKNSKRKTNLPPSAKWLAADTDALEDLSLIRKIVPSGTTKKSGAVKKK
ncbi:Breast cancer metastasis-suppressor 1 [Haplosporangium sp. Z 11]|nr:Breast cancer metastasis-suppressor 1 [Haplosporangium sp. Z 11]